MKTILTLDFGSTNTKATLIDLETEQIIANAVSYTTIETDVCIGLDKAKKQIFDACGVDKFDYQVACSSAAGGLKMIACGLVPDLTVKAAKMAASSAGAKILKSYAYELSEFEIKEIEELKPDIVLLCGGIDGGNKDVIIHNAKMLASIDMYMHVIVAGNKSASFTASSILRDSSKNVVVCENVMPEFGNLNILPVKSAIAELFMERIVHAKGLDSAQEQMSSLIVPTPLAVFDAALLLGTGTKNEAGFNEIMVFDVGGATTDVYSICSGEPKQNAMLKGLKEPFAKRSVEGDIGVRYSLSSLIEAIDFENVLLPEGITKSDILEWGNRCKDDCSIVPLTDVERVCDCFLAMQAVAISMNRHVGTIETVYTPLGAVFLQTGKDLTEVDIIVGSGGSVINAVNPKEILFQAIAKDCEHGVLKPKSPEFFLDKRNIMAAMGLISKVDSDIAIRMMKNYLLKI